MIFALLVGVTTGGVDDPNRDGIEIDESDEVDETGEGIAVTLVVGAGTEEFVVLAVGANKFDIVGECFLLDAVVIVFAIVVPGDVADGDEICFAFGEDSDVDVLVQVEGILLLFTVVDATDAFPFGIAAVVLVVWPLF